MKRLKRLLNKVNKIVEDLDIQDIINKIESDEEESFYIQLNELNVYYQNNDEYKMKIKNKYKNYEEYNDYDMEEYSWTSLKAS